MKVRRAEAMKIKYKKPRRKMAAGLSKLRVRRVNVQKKKFQTVRATDTTMSRTDWMTDRTGAGIRGRELTVSSIEPTVSPKSSRAFLLTASVRSDALSCTAAGLLASRGRQRIIRSAITRSPHCRRIDTVHTGCTGWNSSCNRQIFRLIFCFCSVDSCSPPLLGSTLSD